jgi:predicted DCC family thiol-disulfide oxidoreductase YuxK
MTREKHILLFDSDCPLCTFQSRLLYWMDWFNVVEMVPLNDARAAAI